MPGRARERWPRIPASDSASFLGMKMWPRPAMYLAKLKHVREIANLELKHVRALANQSTS